jgi:hypothetical protein
MGHSTGRNDSCPCGSGKKFKRCCIDLPRKPVLAALRGPDNTFAIVLETPDGYVVREISNAMAIPPGMSGGVGAEHAIEHAAAVWGLPDFICRAEVRQRGAGYREIGDRIVVIGTTGLIVQAKSRQGPGGNPERERAWLSKNVQRAISQARGSLREIRAAPVRLSNARARCFEMDGATLRWTAVVIIDHPSLPPEFVPDTAAIDPPTVVLTRQDWDFLFAQLKSTHAVAAYINRVVGEPVELGTEPLRYYDLALDDLMAKPDALDTSAYRLGGPVRHFSSPMLPLNPAAAGDEADHRMFRLVLEDIAVTSLGQGQSGGPEPIDEESRLAVLAELDRLPMGLRSQIGRYLVNGLGEMKKVPPTEVQWRMRRVFGGRGTEHLAFGVGSRSAKEMRLGFGAWVSLRHQQALETMNGEDLTTVGVILTPRFDHRAWDTTMVAASGQFHWGEDGRRRLEGLWPLDPNETLVP